ncbi:MAG TPA: hypothetical protein VIY56_10760 [Vicinamibacterales bacterium]
MPKPNTDRVLENIDRRLSNVEQTLPTLATKEELRAAVAPLASRDEMHSAIATAVAPLATKDQVRAEAEQTRRHFDVVAESLRTDIRLIAEGHVHVTGRMDAFETKTERAIVDLDRRVLRLEAKRFR